jgi:YHS domain-containing protein
LAFKSTIYFETEERRTFKMVKDPVCGMVVDPAKTETTADYEGKTYYFCIPGCQTAFEKAPEKFIEQAGTDRGKRNAVAPEGE